MKTRLLGCNLLPRPWTGSVGPPLWPWFPLHHLAGHLACILLLGRRRGPGQGGEESVELNWNSVEFNGPPVSLLQCSQWKYSCKPLCQFMDCSDLPVRLLKQKLNDYMEKKWSAERRKENSSHFTSLSSTKFLGGCRHGFRSTRCGLFQPGLYAATLREGPWEAPCSL